MSLFKEWNQLLSGQTEETYEKFWQEYSSTEKTIYQYILEKHNQKLEGKFEELTEKFHADKTIFMGFLDGIQTSLNNPFDLEEITEESEISLDIDYEKLLFNMYKAQADYLYSLSEWENIFTDEKRAEILKSYKNSKTVHKEKTPGRNDPCPCGSGKKYKKCCGK